MPLLRTGAAARHLLVGLGTGVLALIAGALPLGKLVELKAFDLAQTLRSPGHAHDDIVIVAIDEPSFADLRLQWPWPRQLHARLIDQLAAGGAAAIGFDLLLAEPSAPEDDAALARAMGAAGSVVLASALEHLDDPRFSGEMLIEPVESLAEVAATGLATIPLDRDFVVRRYPPHDPEYASFAEAVVRLRTGASPGWPDDALIAYAGPPGTFTTVSYYQALASGEMLPRRFFAGKTVLVGRALAASPEPGGPGPDLFATPFLFRGGSLMSGVEIHANMVAGLLERRFLARLAPWQAGVLAIVLGLAGSLLQFRWRAGRSALVTAGGVLVFGLVSLALFAAEGWSIPVLPAVFAAVVPYGSFGLVAYFEVERKRREIRQAFGHYLAPAILEEILADPARLRLGGRTADVTLLFTDLAGFTTLSERVAPSEVGRFLNRYFTEMTRIVFAHDGTVDKFIGDALVAFWGAPVADPDHARKACRAALAMQERMRTLREEMAREGFPELHMRIGVNSGEAIVGNMGSSDLFNYTALGDTVNLAARLEGANKEFGTSVLVSDSVRMRAGPAIRTRPLGALKVRGRSEETLVFELTGLGDERTDTEG